MAEIFLARSASLDGFEKDLVIKRIRPDYCADEKFSSMFIDEAKISISLTHQNIVQVFDFGQTDGAYYLAMEHIFGCDLDEIFALPAVAGKGIEPALALHVAAEVCRGLDYAHNKRGRRGEELNIIHRDISPQNVMLSFDGGVKITDFGIAKARGRLSQTEPGMVLGKLAYMSPEHATGQPIDCRSDIFSLGVVLWELLVGKRVYDGEPGPEMFRRIRHAEILPPSQASSAVPKKLDAVVMRAVAADPTQRYQSAREFGNELHQVLVQRYPQFTSYGLQSFLEGQREALHIVGFDDIEELKETVEGVAAKPSRPAAPLSRPSATPVMPIGSPSGDFDWTPELISAVETFRAKPSLWQLVKMGEVCSEGKLTEAAVAVYRVAAVKFAQRGLFAQAMYCIRRMLRHRGAEELRPEVEALPSLAGRSNLHIAANLFRSDGPVEHLLRELLADTNPSHGLVGEGTPLLAALDGPAFAELVTTAPFLHFEPDTPILRQGDGGRTMYLIARGRVLIHAAGPTQERIYLSSLTAGDFFGENSFFTGAKRSATVEALYPTDVLEIDKAMYDKVMRDNPNANQLLLKFYKERIVDVVLAKSPVFGLLPNDDRRAILSRFDLRVFPAGQLIIKEGEQSDSIYLIKEGEAEVFTDSGGVRKSLSTIGSGTVFGEVAALRKIRRTASVQATTKLETLCLPGREFETLLAAKPEVRKKVLDVVAERVRENLDKLVRFRPMS
jgi:serine/threonine protein kinase/CRP-like cAMP-binding protein